MAIALNVTDGSNITVSFNSGPLNGGVPGGNANSLQYNNNGVFGGINFTSYANGNLTLGPVGNIKITGGTPGQVLSTDAAGNLSWVTSTSANTVATTGSGLGFTLANTVVGNVTTVQFTTPTDLQLRATLNIGNVANSNYNGNTQQWLRGDGTWANIPVPTSVANAIYANTAGSVAAANIVGIVANAVYSDTSGTATTALTVPGSGVSGTVANAAHAVSSDTSILAFAVDGANVIGAVPLAANATNAVFATTAGTTNYAPYAGNVTLSNQPNITQLGTLLGLSVSGVSNLNTVNNVKIGGGINGQFLTTDGSGNLTWSTLGLGSTGITSQPSIEWIAPTTANNQTFSGANLAAFADETYAELYLNGVLIPPASYDITGSTLTINVLVNAGERITIGPVAAALVNSVPFANVSNTANTAANANYSNFSGTAYSVSGSNVVGIVARATLANVAAVANTVAGANVTGIVPTANRANIANVANSVAGANVVGAVPLATLATLATSAQSVPGGNITGVVANANYSAFSSVAASANSVQAANVVGTVNSANAAFYAGNVTLGAQPNITSVGTLSSLSVSGSSNLAGGTITPNITGISSGLTLNSGGVLQNITLNASSNVIDASNNFITNLRDPQQAQDAATKNYVDTVAQGLFVKQSTQCATDGPLAATTTYINGTLGVGATLVFTVADAPATLDGYTLVNGDRILVKDQVDPVQNGIYVRTNATTWTRSADGNQPSELERGDFLLVLNGIQNAGSGWIQSTVVTTIGTDPVLYNQFSSAGSYTAGAGLTLTGTQFSITDTPVVAGGYGNGTHVGSFTVNSRGQLVAATNTPITPFANALVGNTLSSNVVFSSLTTVGTLSNLSVTGAVTVGGNITAGNIAATNIDGQLTDGYQPNIYQLGALANLQVIGEANIGHVSNVVITGGTANSILTAVDANGNVAWSNTLNLAAANIGNLNVTQHANLGNVANIYIGGGNNGQVLHSYGNGSVYWANVTGGGNTSSTAFQPSIEFVAPVNGAGQSFTNANISTFANKEFTSVYVNGALQRQSEYSITGNVLTFSRYLLANSEITVGSTATTTFTGGTVTSITTTQIDPDSLGFTLETPGGLPITSAGTITLVVPSAAQFAAAVNKKDYVMASYDNSAGQPVTTVGQTLLFPALDIAGGVTYNSTTSVVSLQANVAYSLRASSMQWGIPGDAFGPSYVKFKWVYAANGLPISGGGTGFVGRDKSGGGTETVDHGSMSCETIVKSSANVDVKLAVTELAGLINSHIMRSGTITVQQI